MRTTFKNEVIQEAGGIFVFLLTILGPALLFSQQVDTAWVRHYNGPGNGSDGAAKMVLDNQGNICITGTSQGDSTGTDIVTLKYDPDGDLLWERRYNVSGNGADEGKGIAVDENGNVYVTGRSTSAGRVGVTIKYDSSGNQLWVALFNGSSNDWDELFNIGLDINENVYVTGVTYVVNPPFSNFFPVVLKYSPNGTYLRGNVLSSGGGALLAVLPQGGAYLGGGLTLAKSDSSLIVRWVKSILASTAIFIDARGDVYSAATRTPGHDYALTKLDSGGNQFWGRFYNGPGNGADVATDLAITPDNRFALVTGYSQGSGTGYDIATIKYDSSGNELWVQRFNGPANSDDAGTAIAVDSYGSVYVTGNSMEIGSHWDYTTLKYDLLGDLMWVQRYNGLADSTDQAVDIAVDSNSNIYVTGSSYNGGSSLDIVTIKYVQFQKGDFNEDGALGLTDIVLQLNCVFLGEGDCPLRIADLNCDGSMSAADVVILLLMFYASYSPPC